MPEGPRPAPEAARPLPRPSNDLHELVVMRQRERTLRAAIELIGERGYLETPLDQIALQAQMAWRTLTRNFASKDEIYLAAFDQSVELASAHLSEPSSEEQPWAGRISEAIETLVGLIAAEPQRGRFCLLHYQSAGPRARRRYETLIGRLAGALRNGRSPEPNSRMPDRLEESVVAGLAWLVQGALADDDIGRLRAQIPEMVQIALGPFVVEEARIRVRSRTARRRRAGRPISSRGSAASGPSIAADFIDPPAKPRRDDDGRPSSVDPLPSGRHGLSREFVRRHGRGRLIRGCVVAVSQNGYADTSIGQICAEYRVSTSTFYEHFDSKEDCCLASYELLREYLREAVADQVGRCESWPEQVVAAVEAVLDFLAASPEVARFLTIESVVPQKIAASLRDSLAELIPLLKLGREEGHAVALPEDIEEVLLGGAVFLISQEVNAGRAGELPDLVSELATLLLRPYVGLTEASELVRAEAQ